jgi:hypothetical protein
MGNMEDPEVIVCDVPYSISFPHPILGKFVAELDLFDALFAPSRKKEI